MITCFITYLPNGCAKCMNRTNVECGWCNTFQSCTTEDQCSDWSYGSPICDESFCNSFTNRRDCKHPCAWSYIHGTCYIRKEYRELKDNTVIIVFFSFIVLVIFAIIFCARMRKFPEGYVEMDVLDPSDDVIVY